MHFYRKYIDFTYFESNHIKADVHHRLSMLNYRIISTVHLDDLIYN